MNKKYIGIIFTCIVTLSFTNSVSASSDLTPQYSMFKICDIMGVCKEGGDK